MSENEYNFQKLTPINDVDLKVYESAINFVFENEDIKNVAISGAYGSGKSSLIESYKDKYKKFKFLHISLAHFRSDEKEICKGKELNNKELILEGKILNQLIHQIDLDKIPQTNFIVKKQIEEGNIAKRTSEIAILILSIIHITYFESWHSFVNELPLEWLKSILWITTMNYGLLISGIVIFIILYLFVFRIIKIQMNKNIFRKFKFQGNEIDVFEDTEESLFDKYLNEVLYIFENADVDVIVFEDLDRFEVNNIFERLREINVLSNIQLKKNNKKPLRFFYLLKDDIFISKDRTKFFDFIIPVVPVMDSSNSYNQFIKYFKEVGLIENFSEHFLQGLALYVDDMRILKNIYNEFMIYYNSLNTTELNPDKMLGIIVYKNIFPRDFSELQLNKGFVFSLFDQKRKFIEIEKELISKKILEIEKEKDIIRNEHLRNINEIEVIYSRYSNRWGELSSEYREEKNSREKIISQKLDGTVEEIDLNIKKLNYKLQRLKSKSLAQIIETNKNIDSIFKLVVKNELDDEIFFNDVKESNYFPLLKYLIRNSYIDETYADYMTYFYENSLSSIDKIFLRSITDEKSKEFEYSLKNPELVITGLREEDFDKEEVLNFDLLEYLLKTPNKVKYLNRFLVQLKSNKNLKFVGEFLDTNKEVELYVKNINKQWTELLSYMIIKGELSEIQIRYFSIYTLYYSDNNILKDINTDNSLSNYISNSSDYLEIDTTNISRLIETFKFLNILFVKIDYEKSNKDLFEKVYQNSLYKLNFDNIVLMLKTKYKIKNSLYIYSKNYTLIQSKGDSPLYKYVSENISEYIDIILENNKGELLDSERSVLSILNNDEINIEQKSEYIRLLKTKIIDISSVINEELWNSLLEKQLIKYSENNICTYFKSNRLNNMLVNFINSDPKSLDFSNENTLLNDKEREDLFTQIIISNDLNNKKYKNILCDLEYTYNNFAICEIEYTKFKIIIEENIIEMTSNNIEFIRGKYNSQALYFIKNNLENFAEICTEELLVLDELLEILRWDVEEYIKLKLLNLTSEEIRVDKEKYSINVNRYIIEYNLSFDDVPMLLKEYETWDKSIQPCIFDVAIKNLDSVLTGSKNVSKKLINQIFEFDKIDIDEKIDILIKLLPNLTKNECEMYLDIIGLSNYKDSYSNKKRPRYAIDNNSIRILKAFKEKGFIYGFEEDIKKEGFYKIIKSKAGMKTLSAELL